MSNNIRSWLLYSVSAMIFVVALSSGFYLFRSISDSIEAVSSSNRNLTRNVHSTLKDFEKPVITGQEVALSVIQIPQTKIDIIVNNQIFLKTLEFDQIDISTIPLNISFKINYERDDLGNITKVIYTGI